jgi:hypothetical protein
MKNKNNKKLIKIKYPQLEFKTKLVEMSDDEYDKYKSGYIDESDFVWSKLTKSEKEKILGGRNEIESAIECGYAGIQ